MPGYEEGDLTALDNGLQIAQTQFPNGDIGAAFTKMFISLIILIVLLWITYRFLKRFMQNRLQKGGTIASIQILERKMISQKTMLYVIKIEGKKILLAESHLEIKRLEGFENEKPEKDSEESSH